MTRPIHRNFSEIPVFFTPAEISEITRLAEERQSIKEASRAGLTDKRILARDNTETHRIGLMGEYAVSKVIGLPLDDKAYLAGDKRGDFQLYGLWVEVKTQRGYLVFNDPPDDFTADIAVLVIHEKGRDDVVWVQGFIPRKDFAAVCFQDDFRHGPRKCVQPARLAAITSLTTYCMMARNDRYLARKLETIGAAK